MRYMQFLRKVYDRGIRGLCVFSFQTMTNIHRLSVRTLIQKRRFVIDRPVLADVHKLLSDIIGKLPILAACARIVHRILVPRRAQRMLERSQY